MKNADKESCAMMNYEEDLEGWEEAALAARQKAEELQQARAEDEARIMEFNASRVRDVQNAVFQ